MGSVIQKEKLISIKIEPHDARSDNTCYCFL